MKQFLFFVILFSINISFAQAQTPVKPEVVQGILVKITPPPYRFPTRPYMD